VVQGMGYTIIDLDPFESSHYLNYGNFLRFSLHNNDEAEKMYLKALELDPEERRNLTTLAKFYEEVKHLVDEAKVLKDKVTELDAYVIGKIS
jgi:tetratricopeptide (TPR) repeat protein